MNNKDFSSLSGINKKIVPFLVCGDLSGFDADTTYPLQVKKTHLTAVGSI